MPEIYTVGCDSCGYYVEFTDYGSAMTFFEEERRHEPWTCEHELGIVVRSKDLDFR